MKPEWPPLYAHGFIPMTLAQVEHTCVHSFPSSTTRVTIFAELQGMIDNLSNIGVQGEVWLDGSFMTHKIDPEDVDLVLCCPGVDFTQWPHAAQTEVIALSHNRHRVPFCEVFVVFDYPDNHPQHVVGANRQSYWRGWFGFSRSRPPQSKGIGLVTL